MKSNKKNGGKGRRNKYRISEKIMKFWIKEGAKNEKKGKNTMQKKYEEVKMVKHKINE